MSSSDSPMLSRPVNSAAASRADVLDRRGHQQRDRGQEQQAGLQARVDAVELLHVVRQPAEQERRAQHEERVGDDRAGD